MRRYSLSLMIGIILLASLTPVQAWAQEEEGSITLELSRIFGFRLVNRIQGQYNFVVKGPEDLARVEILVDGEVVYETTEEPFKIGFNTAEFSPGQHSFSAIGYTESGGILKAGTNKYTVLSADEAKEGLAKYVLPLIVGLAVIMLLVERLSGLITGRKGKVRIGEYGAAGGAICKRCGMPFSRHFLSPNLVVGKLERCPNCGAVAIVGRGSPMELREAEERLLASMQYGHGRSDREETEEDRLKRMIDDSRYDDF